LIFTRERHETKPERDPATQRGVKIKLSPSLPTKIDHNKIAARQQGRA
jgi:hypothetical protein